MGIDVVIAIILVVAVIIGYQRGVIQPLLVEIFFFGTLLVILRERTAFSRTVGAVLGTNPVTVFFAALIVAVVLAYIGGMIGGLIHRTPVVRGVDSLLGIFVHLVVAFIVCYLGLSVLVTLERAFAPISSAASLTVAQINTLQKVLDSNAVTKGFIDVQEFNSLRQASAAGHGAIIAQSPQLNQLETIYIDFLQAQLETSHLARPVLTLGQHIPLLGHVGPQDLPHAPEPSPAASPSPSPKG